MQWCSQGTWCGEKGEMLQWEGPYYCSKRPECTTIARAAPTTRFTGWEGLRGVREPSSSHMRTLEELEPLLLPEESSLGGDSLPLFEAAPPSKQSRSTRSRARRARR